MVAIFVMRQAFKLFPGHLCCVFTFVLLFQVLFFPAMKPEDQDKSNAQKTAHPLVSQAAKQVGTLERWVKRTVSVKDSISPVQTTIK